ncbi:MAG: hypothetical protein A2X94_10730 [Bdellovibrionales bacterium GWB1_55_8]|nr:MAG: hypothetical protein A2X94_10730 [Bdellovibrionales bacterium GWB1_55_8]
MPAVESLPSIFDYDDYRAYLRDVLGERRKAKRGYTIAQLSKSLGFSSHAGLAMVLTGKRELRGEYIEKCVKNLKLSLRQQLYFEAMIRADRLSTSKRKALLQEIELRSTKWEPPASCEGVRLIDFFLVQQILSLFRGYVPLDVVQRHFRYQVDKRDVEGVLSWMIERKFVEKSPLGYRINRSVLMVQDEMPNASGKQFHKDCLAMAASALDSDAIEDREFQTYLVTVDSGRIPEMKRWLKKLVLEAISEFETELDGDTVMQMHFNLFEMSNRVAARGKAEI